MLQLSIDVSVTELVTATWIKTVPRYASSSFSDFAVENNIDKILFFFYVMCLFMKKTILTLHNSLSFLLLGNICPPNCSSKSPFLHLFTLGRLAAAFLSPSFFQYVVRVSISQNPLSSLCVQVLSFSGYKSNCLCHFP